MKKRKRSIIFNFDSLTDIVSNNLGIIIIFTIIVALLSIKSGKLIKELSLIEQKNDIKVIKIPWRHFSKKKALITICEGNRIFFIDEVRVFQKILQKQIDQKRDSLRLEMDSYFVTLRLLSNEPEYMVTIEPIRLQGEVAEDAIQTTSKFYQLLKSYSPDNFYVFTFVKYDSFDCFIKVRDFLKKMNYDVGWSPVESDQTFTYVFNKSSEIKNALLPQ